ncbi:MAG: Nif3-like dinuclear metal center hexameric protein [Clostridia bacterium]|nr:Nif3-like dinuclear metal center hexameric protein [Clostridia bacterium]
MIEKMLYRISDGIAWNEVKNMTTVRELYRYLEEKCPRSLSCAWDNDGMMCSGNTDAEVKHVLCALDMTKRVAEEAEELGCDCIVTHHPMIFSRLSHIDDSDAQGRLIIQLLKSGISVMSFHTRLDAAEGGVNDTLCRRLGLIPEGAFGENGEALGRIARTQMPMSCAAFCTQVKGALRTPVLHAVLASREVRCVAVLGGDGKDDWRAALAAGADTYVTGTMSYNTLLDAKAAGLNVIAAGHFFTENPVMETVASWIGNRFPSVKVSVSETPCEVLSV